MPASSLFRNWILACALAVVAVVLAGLLFLKRPSQLPETAVQQSPPAGGAATTACGLPPFESVRADPGADGPPVILWASGEVRLYLDDEAAFSPPEAPRHFPVGEHTLRVEADGHAPFSLQLRFEAWTPVLLHAELDPRVGLTLVRLNAHCVSCPASLQETESISVRVRETPGDPMVDAAVALRGGDWLTARDALEQVPESERETAPFHRLASVVFVDTHATEAARELLRTLPGPRGQELRPLISRQEALFEEEEARRREVQLHRWNRATERYGALVERYGLELPKIVGQAGTRLEALSTTFSTHHEQGDVLGAEEALLAAEDALLRLARRLQASRPDDCAFQTDVVRMATTG